MKVIVIDPTTATVREDEWDGKTLEQLYRLIRTTIVVRVQTAWGILWVDEEGKLKLNAKWVVEGMIPEVIYGVGVLVPHKKAPPDAIDVIKASVKWGLLFNPHGPVGGSS